MKTLQNKAPMMISSDSHTLGTSIALPSQPAETPQQKDSKTMTWYADSTVSGSSVPPQPGSMHAANAAAVVHAAPAYAESAANPIIARAFALRADMSEAY